MFPSTRFWNWLLLVRDTIQYIRLYGWDEYRLARQRYDRHQRTLKDQAARYTKQGEIARAKAQAKARRR